MKSLAEGEVVELLPPLPLLPPLLWFLFPPLLLEESELVALRRGKSVPLFVHTWTRKRVSVQVHCTLACDSGLPPSASVGLLGGVLPVTMLAFRGATDLRKILREK